MKILKKILKQSQLPGNPLDKLGTEAEFLAKWPGSTCKKLTYEPGLTVYVLRLADGKMVAIAGNESCVWDRGMSTLLNS